MERVSTRCRAAYGSLAHHRKHEKERSKKVALHVLCLLQRSWRRHGAIRVFPCDELGMSCVATSMESNRHVQNTLHP